MTDNQLKFVDAGNSLNKINWTETKQNVILYDAANTWSYIKENDTVNETELQKYISDYKKFLEELEKPDLSFWIGHKDPEYDNRRSDDNTRQWISETTDCFFSKKFHTMEKRPFSEEETARQMKEVEEELALRKLDVEPPNENAPWFSSMADSVDENRIFKPLRKDGVRIGDVKFPIKLLEKKVEKLLQEQREESLQAENERKQKEDDSIKISKEEHLYKMKSVLEELQQLEKDGKKAKKKRKKAKKKEERRKKKVRGRGRRR